MELKTYQKAALTTLGNFLEECLDRPVSEVYSDLCVNNGWAKDASRVVYHDRFHGAPAVCLRVPTGGGKTVIAAASVKIVDDIYLQTGGAPVVLWLTPSDVITQQTLSALQNKDHAYYQRLESDFAAFKAVGIDEFASSTKASLDNCCTIVVANIQTFNISNTDQRKVYSYREDISSHFTGLTAAELEALEKVTADDIQVTGEGTQLRKHNVGDIKHSVANLLRLHHPYIVVDEAHNNRTDRFFDTLNRLAPRAILELTATPTLKNNVIYQVSAWELKADNMIKLPVILSEHSQTGWQACVDKSVAMRRELERKASDEPDYVRPIVLIQAQKKGETPSPQQVRDYLIESQHVPEAQIAIATGEQKDLADVDLLKKDCAVRFVITIQALKEGWDCSFAYILCGLQNIQSAKDTEQLVGRVLRMPYAKRRKAEELNSAYANILSETTQALARTLKDRLVETMGFDKMEAEALVETQEDKPPVQHRLDENQPDLFSTTTEPAHGIDILVSIAKDPEETKNAIKKAGLENEVHISDAQPQKGVVISVNDKISSEAEAKLREVLSKGENSKGKAGVTNAMNDFHAARSKRRARIIQETPFPPIPQLCFTDPDDGDCRVLETSSGLAGQWNPGAYETRLAHFEPRQVVYISQLDVNRFSHLQYDNIAEKVSEIGMTDDWLTIRVEDLVQWLAQEVRRPDVTSVLMAAFVSKVVNGYLIGERRFTLSQLLQLRVQIANALKRLLAQNYEKACKAGFQQQLGLVCETPEEAPYQFRFDPNRYTPKRPYDPIEGGRDFKKHFYPIIHDLHAKTSTGREAEEFRCAVAIDTCVYVKRWVRNIEQSPYSFRLPTSDDYFYPDFVAELSDGRIFVVEYKGKDRESNEDSKEKALIGELWEKKSRGRGIFLMASSTDAVGRNVEAQISDKIKGI